MPSQLFKLRRGCSSRRACGTRLRTDNESLKTEIAREAVRSEEHLDTSSTTQAYRYDELKPASAHDAEIRVLVLAPGAFSNPIAGRLRTVALHDHPPFVALSYTWGSPSNNTNSYFERGCDEWPCFVALDGVQIQITGNLEDALRRLRFESSERILWVDALCINQQNNMEKSDQIRLMTTIYNRASYVLA